MIQRHGCALGLEGFEAGPERLGPLDNSRSCPLSTADFGPRGGHHMILGRGEHGSSRVAGRVSGHRQHSTPSVNRGREMLTWLESQAFVKRRGLSDLC